MEKVSIIFLIDVLQELGGAEKNVFQLATGLDRDKYNIIVCCLKSGDAYKLFKKNNINVIDLDIGRIYGFNAILKAIKLIKLIKKEKVKIFLTYFESSDLWGSIVARIAGVPVVISSRRDMGFNLKKRHILAYRIIDRFFTKIISVCDAVKLNIIKNELVNSDKIVSIYNGVDINVDYKLNDTKLKRNLGLDVNKQTVTMLANFHPIKKHKNLLIAAQEVINKNKSVQFLLVGESANGYKNELIDLAHRLNINNDVIFAGFRENVSEILSLSDISVLTSGSEGLSNTILESMAAGKPVIATRVGGNPELVIEGETGVLVSSDSSADLAKAITCLLEKNELAKTMGVAGRSRVEKFFSEKIMIEEIENLFDVLIKQNYSLKMALAIKRRIKRIIKLILSVSLYYSGLVYIYEKFKPKNNLKILAYHKISDNLSFLDLTTKTVTFRKQMEYLKRHYKIISLEEAVCLLDKKAKFTKKTAVITFDDGDKSIFLNAFPILKELNIPATIFLTVSPIESGKNLWFEFIMNAISMTKRKTLNLEQFTLGRYLINAYDDKLEAVKNIAVYVKKLNAVVREKFINFLCKELIVDPEEINKIGSLDILSWAEIREMKNNGITFGAHTMSHHILTNIPFKEAEFEIAESKRIIEGQIGQEVKIFAYPNGGRSDFNNDIEDILKKHNFSAACTLINQAYGDNIFELKRINIHEELTNGFLGGFSESLFSMRLLGIFNNNKK